ncbi:hypothetical protein ABR738_02200 [Streptomyces sp. Edi4]|uniref:hypothetical protein n=1 Tax=Streptomyces sp. Edi4 TaxID=3162527 RepID=UPI003305E009
MDASEIAQLRTMYIFTPADGETWGLSYAAMETAVRERDPDGFLRLDEGTRLVPGTVLHFGITLGDETLEGMARLRPEGVSLEDCTASQAAEFAAWLQGRIVPAGVPATFNTEWGLEAGLPDQLAPHVSVPGLKEVFLAHLQATVDQS